jgi:hypothetical protein
LRPPAGAGAGGTGGSAPLVMRPICATALSSFTLPPKLIKIDTNIKTKRFQFLQ